MDDDVASLRMLLQSRDTTIRQLDSALAELSQELTNTKLAHAEAQTGIRSAWRCVFVVNNVISVLRRPPSTPHPQDFF